MYQLYHYPNSGNSYKARLALSMFRPESDLKVSYVDILAGESRTPEFLKLNPAGQIPLLVIDGKEYLPESHAILWRLGSGTDFLPNDVKLQAQIVRWMCFEQYKLEPKLGVARYWIYSKGMPPDECPVDIPDLVEQTRAAMGTLDRQLQLNDFMVGAEPSIADIAIFGYIPLAPDIGIRLRDYPALKEWIQRFECLPHFISLADEVAKYAAIQE